MNAPVTTAVPGVRSAAPRAADAGRSHSAAPFASALDGALSENRASDRGVERRGVRADRAAEHAADEHQRVEDRLRGAAARALEKAGRTETRSDRAAEAASRKADEKPAHDAHDADSGRPVEDAPAPHPVTPPTDESPEAAGKAAEAPRGGLPALWALLMGGSLAPPPPGNDSTDPGATAPVALPGVPAVDTGVDVPVATPSADSFPADAVNPATGQTLPGAAAPVAEAAARSAASPAGAAGRGLPAVFSAVLAETGAVVTVPAAPAGAAPPIAAAATPALPLELVLDSASAAGTPAAEAPPPAPALTPVVTDSEVEPAAAAPASGSTDAVVAPVGGSAGEALSSDAGGAGGSGGDDAPAATGSTGQATLGPVASTAAPTTAAVADDATGAAATLPVGSQVARQVAVLSGGPDGDHSMTLVLTPETLGEVQVQVTLSKGSIELALRGAHEHGRAALLEALPELRRDLEAAGLNPSRVEVSRDTGGSLLDRQPAPQQGFGERGGQHDRGENRSRPWGRPADTGGSGPSIPNRSTSSGVDVLA